MTALRAAGFIIGFLFLSGIDTWITTTRPAAHGLEPVNRRLMDAVKRQA